MTRPASTRQDSDPDRTIGALLRVGTVQSVDLEAGKVIVAMGDQTTPLIDWLMLVGDTTLWIPPTVGQQVLVLAPEGDIEQAMVLNGLPSSAFAPLFLLQRTARKRTDKLRSQMPDALELMSRSMQAGIGLSEAFKRALECHFVKLYKAYRALFYKRLYEACITPYKAL